SGIRMVSRPACSRAGRHRRTARRAVESLTPNRNPRASWVGYCRSHTTANSTWSAVVSPNSPPAPMARWRPGPSSDRRGGGRPDGWCHVGGQGVEGGDGQPGQVAEHGRVLPQGGEASDHGANSEIRGHPEAYESALP